MLQKQYDLPILPPIVLLILTGETVTGADEDFEISSEGDKLDDSNFPVPKRKHSPTENKKEKNHSLHKTTKKKMDEKPMDESSDDSDFPHLNRKQSHLENTKEKVWSASVDKVGKNHSVNNKRTK